MNQNLHTQNSKEYTITIFYGHFDRRLRINITIKTEKISKLSKIERIEIVKQSL